MLDELKSRLPDTLIYVQAVPPVQTKAVETRPGLEKSKVQAVNVRLAKLALEKGCSFLDLYGAMADENGDLNADYAESDGVHFTASSGYPAWVNFLCTHTVYSKDNPWAKGTGSSRSGTRTGGTRTMSPACSLYSGLIRPLFTRTSPLRKMR